MRTESAEMVKHALNSFLALSITFINEVARLCEHTGADAKEVSAGLKSEPRIGPKAYLGPGGPFAGGTLARDVVTLTKLAEANGEKISVIPAIKQSNDLHRGWAFRRLQSRLGDLRGKENCRARPDLHDQHRHPPAQRGGGIVPATFGGGRGGRRVRSGGENICRAEFSRRSALATDMSPPLWTARTPQSFAPSGRNFARRIGRKLFPPMRQRGFCGRQPFFGKGIEKRARRRASFRRTRLNMKLKNLNALITGGSQGLGKVIAEHFLREGANVVHLRPQRKGIVRHPRRTGAEISRRKKFSPEPVMFPTKSR